MTAVISDNGCGSASPSSSGGASLRASFKRPSNLSRVSWRSSAASRSPLRILAIWLINHPSSRQGRPGGPAAPALSTALRPSRNYLERDYEIASVCHDSGVARTYSKMKSGPEERPHEPRDPSAVGVDLAHPAAPRGLEPAGAGRRAEGEAGDGQLLDSHRPRSGPGSPGRGRRHSRF